MTATAPQRSSYDLVVVGAGAVGLAAAWRATQAGLSVLVLERDRAGSGASGVAAGMLAPVTEADFGEQELLALNVEGRALWGGFAAELEQLTGRPAGYADSGCLVVAVDRDDAAELRRAHDHQRRLGLEAEWLTPGAARALEPGLSPRIAGAISTPDDGLVEPRAVVAALVAALSAGGGELVEGTGVAALTGDAGRVDGVRTTAGHEVRAGHVLVACGAWSGQPPFAAEPGAPAVRPVKGQLIELSTREGSHRRPRGWCARRAVTWSAAGTAAWSSVPPPRTGASTRRSPPTACSACWRRPWRCSPTWPNWNCWAPAPACARAPRTGAR